MKNWFIMVVCCLMAACNATDESGKVEQEETGVRPRFHATFADGTARTFIDGRVRLRWNAEDLITIFEGTTRNTKFKFLGETGDNAGDFESVPQGFGTGNDVDRHYAVYPYAGSNKLHEDGYITYTFPTEQKYAVNSFGLGANPMVAVTADLNDYDLSFRNVGAYLRLQLYGTETTIKSIRIEGNNAEPLAGKAFITPVYKGNPSMEFAQTATSSVTLTCSEGVTLGESEATATEFWIVLPPTTFTQGFTITVTGFYGGSYTKNIASKVVFERNKYLSAKFDATIVSSGGTGIGLNGWGSTGKEYSGSAE